MSDFFYISDQMVQFLKASNFGNGLAASFCNVDICSRESFQKVDGKDPNVWSRLEYGGWNREFLVICLQDVENGIAEEEGRMPRKMTSKHLAGIDVTLFLRLILERRVANFGILYMLFSLIAVVNDLHCKDKPLWIHYDTNMSTHFAGSSTTRSLHLREGKLVDLTPVSVTMANKNGIARLQLTDARSVILYDPKTKHEWGIHQSGIARLIEYFRIPDGALTEKERKDLTPQPNVNGEETNPILIEAGYTTYYIRRLLRVHQEREAARRATKGFPPCRKVTYV